MNETTLTPPCSTCGQPLPQGATVCPACGASQVEPHADAATSLPAAPPPDADAVTMSGTAAITSLDSPSPRPRVPAGDGPFQQGQQISPRYTILKLLGTGGMGTVYQAFDHELGVAVAIKVIRPAAQSDATAAKELEARFKRELVLARQVTHKYVVRIHDLGEIAGVKYLTMPFVEGETLAQSLRKVGKLPLARVIKIAQQIAQGLAAAHEKGVVHRDLKPENIMLEQPSDDPVPNRGDALIMDFGIARSVEGGATQTAAGSVIGTLEYMAPEQAQGQKVDQRADQYAFGLMIYDMLVGRQRLANRDHAMGELFARMAAPPPSPRTIDPSVPEPVDQIVTRLLATNPADRFASTHELVQALDRLTPDGHLRPDVHEVIVPTPARPKWQLAASALAIVTLAMGAGWVFSRGNLTPAVQAAHEPISVLIGDFENKTGDAVFDGVVEQALSLGIEGASFINSFARRDALRAAEAIKPGSKLDEQTSLLVALRENLGMVLVGSIAAKGSGYHINIKGLAPGATTEVKYTLEDDAKSKADVLQTVGSLAGRVRSALGDTVAPAPSDNFTAANLEAVRAYARGQELFAAGKADEAIAAYLEATTDDPTFGRGYASAATAANNLGKREEAAQYYDKALANIDRMTEREKLRTRGQYYLFSRNAPKAIEEFTALVEKYPSDAAGLSNLANAHSQLRQFDQAVAIGSRVAAMFPKNPLRQNNVALYAMYAGKFDDAIAQGKRAAEANANYALAYVSQALGHAALGQYDEAAAAYKTLAAKAGWEARAAIGVADLAMLRGHLHDAAAALEPMLTAKIPAQQLTRVQTSLATIRLAQGRSADAIKLAESALTISNDAATRFEAGRILLAGGRDARVKELAAELEKSLIAETQALGLTLAGEMSLVKRDQRAAITAFQEALKLADPWQTRYLLGRAYLEAESFTEAEGEFDKCITRRGEATAVYLDDVPTWHLIAPVYYYQGIARAGMRNTAGAAERLRTYIQFKDGGDEQNALVADAKKRLAQ